MSMHGVNGHMAPILVTGGAGFIGANFVHEWLAHHAAPVINLDKLTYAGHPANLAALRDHPAHLFIQGDILDSALVTSLLDRYQPAAIVHFAAESHVDRSIHAPGDFIQTNICGTFTLLQAALAYWSKLSGEVRQRFRFLHVSTDEVYGDLQPDEAPFSETTRYAPNSPYSASKAASDHLVRAYCHTYGLPAFITHCSNNYGPYQFPEKLIPLCLMNALQLMPLPVYGDGKQVRDWLYVTDHCAALRRVLARGRVGETYNIGGANEIANIDVVREICSHLDTLQPRPDGQSYARLIRFVGDRPGHDRRYAIDAGKMQTELNWAPTETFKSGLSKTIHWYLNHPDWIAAVQKPAHTEWLTRNYLMREEA